MKILVVGGGGREHALLWSLARSPRAGGLYAAPGNGGTAGIATHVLVPLSDHAGLAALVEREGIDLTVIGPEAPLVAGLADSLRARSLPVFGPGAAGARIEGSKSWMKRFLERHGVPTAAFEVFDDPARARAALSRHPLPLVLKADGLAAGKGVMVCATREEVEQAFESLMVRRDFGDAGDVVVMEECLEGEELSVLVVTDGEEAVLLPAAQDHKRIGDGDRGPNTGGMGAYAPAPAATPERVELIGRAIVRPVLSGLRNEGIS